MTNASAAPPEIAKPDLSPVELARATESQWRIYTQINEWIRFADAKAGALLAANVLMTVSAITAFKDHKPFFQSQMVFLVLGIFSLLGLIASAFCCLGCIFPRTNFGPGESLIFFGKIAREFKSSEDYKRSASLLGGEERAFAEITRQVWVNARIADHKHLWIARAVWSIAIGLSVALVVGVGVALG